MVRIAPISNGTSQYIADASAQSSPSCGNRSRHALFFALMPRPVDLREFCEAPPCYAALTEVRNLLTSTLSRLESPDSDCAAESTCEDAEPVSPAPRCTSVSLGETSMVPSPPVWPLRELSWFPSP